MSRRKLAVLAAAVMPLLVVPAAFGQDDDQSGSTTPTYTDTTTTPYTGSSGAYGQGLTSPYTTGQGLGARDSAEGRLPDDSDSERSDGYRGFRAESGPLGEDADGTVDWVIAGREREATVTCLAVHGNAAFISARLDEPSGTTRSLRLVALDTDTLSGGYGGYGTYGNGSTGTSGDGLDGVLGDSNLGTGDPLGTSEPDRIFSTVSSEASAPAESPLCDALSIAGNGREAITTVTDGQSTSALPVTPTPPLSTTPPTTGTTTTDDDSSDDEADGDDSADTTDPTDADGREGSGEPEE